MSRDQCNFRCDKEMKRYLEDLPEDYSKYLRNLVTEDRVKKHDPVVIKSLIKEKKAEIQRLEDLLSSPQPMMDQFKKLLEKHAPGYKKHAPYRSEKQLHRFIEDNILKEAKKFGINKTVQEIHEILINFPDNNGGGVEIEKKENGKNV